MARGQPERAAIEIVRRAETVDLGNHRAQRNAVLRIDIRLVVRHAQVIAQVVIAEPNEQIEPAARRDAAGTRILATAAVRPATKVVKQADARRLKRRGVGHGNAADNLSGKGDQFLPSRSGVRIGVVTGDQRAAVRSQVVVGQPLADEEVVALHSPVAAAIQPHAGLNPIARAVSPIDGVSAD